MMQIGALAAEAGVAADTIRFYERERLLPPAPRACNGYRTYSKSTLARLRMIRQLQAMGLTLAQIRELLVTNETEPACPAIQQQLVAQRQKLRQQMGELNSLDQALTRMLAACQRNRRAGRPCPALDHSKIQA